MHWINWEKNNFQYIWIFIEGDLNNFDSGLSNEVSLIKYLKTFEINKKIIENDIKFEN